MIKKYRSKVVEKYALKWTGKNDEELKVFLGQDFLPHNETGDIYIRTAEGDMIARPGDYIIKGLINEFYPCKAAVFERSYEEVPVGE